MVLECRNTRYAHEAGHTDLCYASDNKCILTCGADGNVRIFNGADDDDPSADSVSETTFAVACTKDLFLVATDNNHVQAFSYPDRNREQIMFRFSAPVTHIAVSSSGKYIAACSCDMEIQVIDTESKTIITLTGHKGPVSGVSLDPLDNFLVSSSCDGTVKIWDISTGSSVKTISDILPVKNDFFRSICLGRTAWRSFSGSVLAVPKDLEVIIYKRYSWEIAYNLTSKNIEKPVSVVLFSPCGNYLAGASISGEIVIWEIKNKTEVCCYNDPKKVGISGIAWHPDGSEISFADRLGRLSVLVGINEEITKHENLKEKSAASEINEDLGDELDTNDLFGNDDDDNCISLEKIKASYKNESSDEAPGSPSSMASSKIVKEPPTILPKAQPPFQPSSTPSHFEPRCLCFNSIGIVRYYDSDKTVDVQFHDTTFHHSLFLRSFGTCTIATLSTNVLCLAVPSLDDNLSKLSCIPLSSWSGCKEWTVNLPENEDILAIAAAGNWVAVATSANHLRIFSSAGTQKQIISLSGPVVSMSGYEQKILLVCHLGMGLLESQNLGCIMYQVSNLHVRTISPLQPLPLFPNSVLNWVGFTDEGTPCSFDSEGILRLLAHDSMHWEVVCDTRNQRKSSSDHYFIVGLSERYQNVRCILCRNSHYPLIINIPTILEIPLKLPLCAIESEKSVQEDIFWRMMFSLYTLQTLPDDKSEYLNDMSSFEQTLKQTALKLFAEACRNSEDMRALDVATFMSSRPLEVAIKYASKAGKAYLAEKLNKLTPVEWKKQYAQIESSSYAVRELDNNQDEYIGIQHCRQEVDENSYSEKRGNEKENYENGASEQLSTSPENPTHGVVNPFKKVGGQTKEGPKGLKFFDTIPKESSKPTKSQVVNKSLKLKSLNTSKIKGSEMKIKKPSFVQWFSHKKAELREEYPNISDSEMTKLGMKIYKETVNVLTKEENSSGGGSDCNIEPKKRGLDEETESENKKCRTLNEDF